MKLEKGNISIRSALAEDAPQLTRWWNDGTVMAHAGFPKGLGITEEEVRRELREDREGVSQRLILQWEGIPIGEMGYRTLDSGAEIGIKICDAYYQERGIGRIALSMLIRWLFDGGAEKIVLDTNLKNLRAQHVYEKLGFQKTAVHVDSWRNQLGQLESAVDYELTEEAFVDYSI